MATKEFNTFGTLEGSFLKSLLQVGDLHDMCGGVSNFDQAVLYPTPNLDERLCPTIIFVVQRFTEVGEIRRVEINLQWPHRAYLFDQQRANGSREGAEVIALDKFRNKS